MARPFKLRTRQTMARDLAHLVRLRSSLVMDDRLPVEKVRIVLDQVDALMRSLELLTQNIPEERDSA